jgi:hypothetical protein
VKILREPLVHFMFIGAFIYLLYGVFAEPVAEETDKTIIVSAGEVEWMKTAWQKRWNRPPTQAEFDGLVQQYIKETVLYLNKHDQIIRRRLAQKLEFLAKDLVNLIPPTDEELQTYFDEHQARYQEPALYTFTQVFIDPDKRGDTTLDDAEAIKATLIAQGEKAIEDAGTLGDDFMLQNYYPEKDQLAIQKQFGGGFTESLTKGYGVHLVYVSSISKPPAPVFADVRERVVQDWTTDKSEELNKQFYASLRDQYTVVIEEPEQKDKTAAVQGQGE